jgi:DNA recombination protein RmuC
MSTPELILTVLLILVIVLLIFIVSKVNKPANSDAKLEAINEKLATKIDEVNQSISKSIFESILKFNDQVNQKLSDSSEKSNSNITDFRLNVNKELQGFKEQLGERLQQDFKGLITYLEVQMNKINTSVELRLTTEFTKTNQTFVQIAERVKVIDEAQKNIEELSNEMMTLQRILSNNQSRGMFGEYQLNQLLYAIYGENKLLYDTQKTIKEARGKSESVRADAVVYMPEPNGMIAIDSKFPFSEYKKLFDNPDLSKEEEEKIIQAFGSDVKKHINDIATKYIIPGVTAEYALMFVPSDGVLSLLHSHLGAVVEHARNKNITIVSPTTLVPLLSSFKAVVIDYERSKYTNQIRKELLALNKEFLKFAENWEKISKTISTLSTQTNTISKDVEKITTKFDRIKNVDLPDEIEEISSTNEE